MENKQEKRSTQPETEKQPGDLSSFNPAAFKDTYISELKKVIKAKAAGKDIRIAEPKKASASVKDLMEVLKQSLDTKKKRA